VSSGDDLCEQYLLDSFALWLPVDQRVGRDRIWVCSSRMKDLWLHLVPTPWNVTLHEIRPTKKAFQEEEAAGAKALGQQ